MAEHDQQRRQVPNDEEAERFVLGACMLNPAVVPEMVDALAATDFYRPGNGAVFAAIVALWERGDPVDAKTVSAEMKGVGASDGDLLTMISSTPSTSNVGSYAALVVAHAARRQLLRLSGEMADAAYKLVDPGDIVDDALARLAAVDLPLAHLPAGLMRTSDLLTMPESDRQSWVVPGLLRRDWRVILVAPEGVGKTLVLQQVGLCASQGIHPFGFEPIAPVRVLFVDLENPSGRIASGYRLITPYLAGRAKDYDEDRAWLWHREGGVNLRTRHDRADLEAVLAAVRPDLVCMGPTYKASIKAPGEGYEEPAMEVARVLDGLRMRYGFALLMEDHAPQATGGRRDLRPIGSSVWLRWPDIGVALQPDQQTKRLTLARFRGDRLENDWPTHLDRGGPGEQPWVGRWETGRQMQEAF